MSKKYTEGICHDGAAILEDGIPLTVEQILHKLNAPDVTDGYHTFGELYEHRCLLFLALMECNPTISWVSKKHHDGTSHKGWFIGGMTLPTGDITYHLPLSLWSENTNIPILKLAKPWDGHDSNKVVNRLKAWVKR